MSEAWPRVSLGECFDKNEDWIALDPTAEYREVTVRLWGKGVVLRGVTTGAEVAADRRIRVRAGQFILSRIDARNGASGVVPPSLDGAIVSGDFPAFEVRRDRLLPEFLGWLAKTQTFVDMCLAASEGTTNRVRLKEDRFLASSIPLPPLAEQRRIVARLDALAAKIEEAKGLKAASRNAIGRLVVSMHLSSNTATEVAIGDVMVLDEDKVPIIEGGEYPQVGVRGFGGGLFRSTIVRHGATTYRAFNRLHEGMILLSQVKGWEGAIAGVPAAFAGMFASPEYRTYRCVKDRLLSEYAAALVRTPWFHAKLKTLTRGVGARRERLRPEMFTSLRINIPSVAEQQRAVAVLGRIDHERIDSEEFDPVLNAVLKGSLNRAVAGAL